MKVLTLLSVIFLFVLSGCSSVYKSGQTPDDVYYSPLQEVKTSSNYETRNRREAIPDFEDREIRMGAYDYRWRNLNNRYDYDFAYNPYSFGYNYGYYYNPYFVNHPVFLNGVVFVNPKNNAPRTTNLTSYKSTALTTFDPKTGSSFTTGGIRAYNNNNNSSNRRQIIYPGYNRNNNNSDGRSSSSDNNSRTYSPSSSSSNNSSGNSNSSGSSVPRNSRGN